MYRQWSHDGSTTGTGIGTSSCGSSSGRGSTRHSFEPFLLTFKVLLTLQASFGLKFGLLVFCHELLHGLVLKDPSNCHHRLLGGRCSCCSCGCCCCCGCRFGSFGFERSYHVYDIVRIVLQRILGRINRHSVLLLHLVFFWGDRE
jgi:hypothetical protein